MSEALKNEIHAYFGKLTTTTTAKVSQWAYGQKLIVHDANLPSVFEAYYSNSRSRGEAKPQIGTDGEAPVPDEYFLSGADIYVFLMEHEGADDGRYRKIVHIPIDPCSQPSDVEPSPVQQSVIDQAIAALNDAVEQTGEDKAATAALAQAAAASSLIASEAATQAQGSATSASASASTASTAAATATTKASEAATSAANAASAKTAAETAETNARAAQTASESAQASAESAAQTATAKATEAATSATNASGSATAASASASAASESATQAAASATSASGSATTAAGSATTASTKASEASASATAAQTAQTAAEAAQSAAETAAATFETDTTLTVSGKAADAKAVGDAIGQTNDALNELKTAVDMVVTQEEITPSGSSQIVDLTGYELKTYHTDYNYYQNVTVPFGSDKAGKKYYMNPWTVCNLTRVKVYDANNTLLSYGESSTTFTTNQYSSIERVNNTTIKKIQGSTSSRYDSNPTETLYEYSGTIDHLIIEMVRNGDTTQSTLLGLAEERTTTYIPYEEGGEPEYQAVYNPDMAEYVHNYIEENYPDADMEELAEKVDNYTETASLVNLYDKSLCEDGKYYNSSQGVIYSNANYAFSGYIPVKPNTQYCISCDKDLPIGEMGSYYQEWTANKTLIQNTQQPYAFKYISQIQTGANTAYISINFAFGEAHTTEQLNALLNTVMLVEGCQRPLEYSSYNAEPTVNHEKIDIMRQINADKFRGKKWLATGTSVTYQDSKVYTEGVAEGELVRGYIGNVSRCKPMLIRNEGISGSTLADTTQSTALINRYQNLNMGDYDFITVEYGINDFGRNVPVGTAQDAAGTSTFAACLKTIIEYALTQNPIVGLIICTDPDVRGTTTNQNGNTLKDYADVTLEIANQYRLPVCDWFYHSGINSLTKGDGSNRYFLTQSGTHPSVYGHMRMGAMLNQVFDSLLC